MRLVYHGEDGIVLILVSRDILGPLRATHFLFVNIHVVGGVLVDFGIAPIAIHVELLQAASKPALTYISLISIQLLVNPR